jgi:hypothetical protein
MEEQAHQDAPHTHPESERSVLIQTVNISVLFQPGNISIFFQASKHSCPIHCILTFAGKILLIFK